MFGASAGVVFSAFLLLGVAPAQQIPAQVSREKLAPMAVLRFKGATLGGGLKLWIKGRILELGTQRGETLEQLAAAVADAINADRALKEQGVTAKADGHELTINVNEVWVFLCTADKGLVVPPSPQDLRAGKSTDGITHLHWKVPRGGYDRIHILRGNVPIADGIDGANTDFADYSIGEKATYRIFGIKNGMPSCAATF